MSENLVKFFKDKIRSSLGKDILITLVAQLTIMILALVVNKLLSVKLGVDGYGQYSIIKKSTQVISFVMLGGMGIAIPRYLSTYLAQNNLVRVKSTMIASLLVILMVGTIVLTVCLLLINTLSPVVVGENNYKLFITGLLFAVSITTSSWLFAYYRGTNSFLNFGISQIVVQVLITIGALFYGGNLILVLNIWSVSTILYVIVSMIWDYSRNKWWKDHHVTWHFDVAGQLKTLFSYGMPRMVGDFFLFSFAAFPLVYINETIGLTSSSFYATGLTLTSMVTPLFGFLGMVLLPYISTAVVQNNFKHTDKLIKQLTIIYVVLSVLAIFVLWLGMDIFIRLFFSEEFIPSAYVARILTASILFESIYLLLRNPIDAVSMFPYNTVNLLICLVVLVVLFSFSRTLEAFAFSYLLVTILKSCLSFLTWQFCKKKYRPKESPGSLT